MQDLEGTCIRLSEEYAVSFIKLPLIGRERERMTDLWIDACAIEDIDDEDLIRFDHGDRTFCIYNTPKGFYATDGYCTHEEQHLEYGICLLYTSPSPRDLSTSRMPSSA